MGHLGAQPGELGRWVKDSLWYTFPEHSFSLSCLVLGKRLKFSVLFYCYTCVYTQDAKEVMRQLAGVLVYLHDNGNQSKYIHVNMYFMDILW